MLLHNVCNSQCDERKRQIDFLLVSTLIAANSIVGIKVLPDQLVLLRNPVDQ